MNGVNLPPGTRTIGLASLGVVALHRERSRLAVRRKNISGVARGRP